MIQTINPSDLRSAAEVRNYAQFLKVKGYMESAAENMTKIDNDDTVDLSPAKGQVAVNGFPAFGGSAVVTGVLNYNVQTGAPVNADLESQEETDHMGVYSTINVKLGFSQHGDNKFFAISKTQHNNYSLSGMSETINSHYRYVVDGKSGLISIEELPL